MSFFSQTVYSKIETSFYVPIYGNYKFDTELTNFGIVKERKLRKVNRSGSILKLKDQKNINSIYPMVDEFGYAFTDFFIFRSTWDLSYHFETSIYDATAVIRTDSARNFNRYISAGLSIDAGRNQFDTDTKTQFE